MAETELREMIREKYGEAARRVSAGERSSCCGTEPAAAGCADPITSNLYGIIETIGLPATAVAASLGCGNPTALAELKPGRDGPRPRLAAAGSTSCSRRGGSARPARSTAST